jgi:hypothetical protein
MVTQPAQKPLQIPYEKMRQKQGEILSGRSGEFVKWEEGVYQFRVVFFEPAPGRDAELAREIGSHFKLDTYGATRVGEKDGKRSTSKITSMKCPNYSVHQHHDPQIAQLLDDLRRDPDRLCSEEEIALLGRGCLICEGVQMLRLSDQEEDQNAAKAQLVNRKYQLNILLRDKESGRLKYKLAEFPPTIYDQILNKVIAPDWGPYLVGMEPEEPAREFSLEVTGKELARRYKLEVTPDAVPVVEVIGRLTNLLGLDYEQRMVRCYTLDEQKTLMAGGTIYQEREEASAAPPPRCFNTKTKSMTDASCLQCTHLARCDNPNATATPAAAAPTMSAADRTRAKLGLPVKGTAPVAQPAAPPPPKAPPAMPPKQEPPPAPPAARAAAPDPEPPQTVEEELAEFMRACDWTYTMADDASSYKRGQASFNRMMSLAKMAFETQPEVVRALWAKHAHEVVPWPFLGTDPRKPVEAPKVEPKVEPAPAAKVADPEPPPGNTTEVKPAKANSNVLDRLRRRQGTSA